MYFDLNVPLPKDRSEPNEEVVARLATMGWSCIASSVDGDAVGRALAGGAPASDLELFSTGGDGFLLREPARVLKLTRVNLKWSHIDQNPTLLARCRKRFDLVACEPECEESLRRICSAVECDVVAIDLARAPGLRLGAQHMRAAVERGVCFEINYSKALLSPLLRHNVFTNARALCRVLRGKNVVISGGSNKPMDVRGPTDVCNLAALFGLGGQDAQHAVGSAALALVERVAHCRCFEKGVQVVGAQAG